LTAWQAGRQLARTDPWRRHEPAPHCDHHGRSGRNRSRNPPSSLERSRGGRRLRSDHPDASVARRLHILLTAPIMVAPLAAGTSRRCVGRRSWPAVRPA